MSRYSLLVNLCDELGADSKNRTEFFARAKKEYLSPTSNHIHILVQDDSA